ncbi:TPA: DUF805 domain-containing protein [Providencia alcalifaciens]|uniref:DUF805 domain-containing protein n=2 Tax=Providencia alcalifaciens TaxID=126385 RepID=A0AAW9VA09_9GAMM|nr:MULTISPECIES: DUF805 domain-containing protein [Providencia]EKT63094.1 hypothetical protein OO9_16721 [Providencia alcalifaciens Dmel2]ETT07697.1 PF05656 family protein [Providencia alcalifaciens F90-2004]EUC94987.1 PF05656 family protein [Providencia alcalifaciens PAL-2]EUD04806.1 PF05656 family protein [Providencia alcalifaciens RIMD 1656011]EUD10653.1 PF05656 family protein [Providencia alcalifaciens 205/92]
MTLLQWAFSFKGRIGRRPFWAGIASCFILVTLISLLQNAFSIPDAVIVVFFILLLYPLAAIFTKRLHDRGKPGGWFALIVLAFALYSIDVSQLADIWQWGIGRFLPLLITMIMLIDCGVFVGMETENPYGEKTDNVDYLS